MFAVHDVGTAGGELFIAMELVAGQSLAQWAVSRDPLEVLRAIVAAGKGLAHAHHAGILHRDFKPGNVLVDKAGRPRVADFGLAADHELAERDASPMGTPGYMAPEIEAGQPASVASDIYAYCRTLADLVLARGGPHWLEPLVTRGLRPTPTERWANLDDLLGEIESELGIDPQNDPRLGRQHRHKVYVVVAAIMVALPAIGLVGLRPAIDRHQMFYACLVPPILFAIVLAVFWRGMTATAFNRRNALSLLVIAYLIPIHHGLTLDLDTSIASLFCEDLLVIAGFVFATAIFEHSWLQFAAAATCVVGAVATAVFPAQAPLIFGATTVAFLPFMYFIFAKGRIAS